jgi:tungstate transport system substrate-binding protein
VNRLRSLVIVLAFGALVASLACHRSDARRSITLATTTSTRDSGLLELLVPRFRDETGIDVKVVAVGTGEALELGRRGDADVLLVHAPDAEAKFMADGEGEARRPVMFNDFVILGPPSDAAHVIGARDAREAFARIASARATFVSRGDSSGTHTKEKAIWKSAQIDPAGDWYKSVGQGMAESLRIANQLGAYALSDRATYLAQRGALSLRIVLEHDPMLTNHYAVIVVSPAKHPTVHVAEARAFATFLVGAKAQAAIASFGADRYGEPLFFTYPADTGH